MRRWNFREGRKFTLNPGDIELIEDLAPTKGHRNRNLGPEDRVVLWVPIADQTVVRDTMSNDRDVGRCAVAQFMVLPFASSKWPLKRLPGAGAWQHGHLPYNFGGLGV